MINSLSIFIEQTDNWEFLLYICLFSFITLFFLGITNQIIIYRDTSDFMWNIFLITVPLFTAVILAFIMPEPLPNKYNFFWETRNTSVISIIGFSISAFSLLKVFINCTRNNGLIFGIVIFIFKVFASSIITILLLAFIGKLFDDKAAWKTLFVPLLLFGLFIFVINRLINGDRVLSNTV